MLQWWQAEGPWPFGASQWSALVESECRAGRGAAGLATYQRMRAAGQQPREATFVALVTALGRHGRAHQAEALFQAMKQEGFPQGTPTRPASVL